jgi:diguanylate cyclase (GGDEF)-like protein
MVAARTDSLTGIGNRAAFLASAERIMDRCRRDAAPVSVIMFDLDRFKTINDRHGHATGDAVLRKFCEIAAASLRPNDLLGRLGGEEFAAMLPGSSVEAAYARAERIRAAFAENCRFVRDQPVNATVSGGVSASTNADETLDALLESSDAALYSAKTEGRNRIRRAGQPRPEGSASNVFRVA